MCLRLLRQLALISLCHMEMDSLSLSQASQLVNINMDVVTLCLSLLQGNGALGYDRYVRRESDKLVSLLMQVQLPQVESEKGDFFLIPYDPNDSKCEVTLQMINYTRYNCLNWPLRVAPQLLRYVEEAILRQHRGELLTVKLLIVKGGGVIAVPHK